MKLKLKNFQAYDELELEFINGINVISGSNSSGKSSIFRAILALLTNPNGSKNYIKHGKNSAEVTLKNNGNELTWQRLKSTVNYIDANGQSFEKASRLDSRDIVDLGFYFNAKGDVVNIHTEWDVLFPFSESDTEIFKLFEDIFNISSLAIIIDKMKADENAINKSIFDLENSIAINTKKINAIQSLNELCNLDELKEYYKKINVLVNSFNVLLNDIKIAEKNNKLSNVTKLDNIEEKINYIQLNNLLNDINLVKNINESNKIEIIAHINANDINALKQLQCDINLYSNNEMCIGDLYNAIDNNKSIINTCKDKLKEFKVCPLCKSTLGEK